MGKGEEEQEEEQLIAVALGNRSRHLPHYNKMQDYLQYVFTNTHTVLGIFCFHRLHPLRYGVRFCALAGSLAMSFAVHNAVHIWTDSWDDYKMFEAAIAEIADLIEIFSGYSATTEQLVIGLIGAPILALFDWCIWHLSALYCCLPGHTLGKYSDIRWVGSVLVVGIVFIVVILSLWLLVVRSAHEGDQGEYIMLTTNATIRSGGITDDLIDFEAALDSTFNSKVDETRRLGIGALTQFVIAMFVTGPFGTTLYFFWGYQRSYAKIEKKLAKIRGDKSRGLSFTDSESAEDDYSVTENDHGNSSDEETGKD